MGLAQAKEYLSRYGVSERITEHPQSSATVELAAVAIGCQPAQIAKTLAFLDREDAGFVVVTDGEAKIDNRKFKDTFHIKAKMCPPEKLKDRIGHEMGGICPFGLVEGVPVYFDRSLHKHEIVYPACGSSNSSIKLKVEELEALCPQHKWIDVTK